MTRAALLFILLVVLPGAVSAAGVDLNVTPADIAVHAFYNGTTVAVEGTVPEGAQVVLRFTGLPEEVSMKRKGKALGLLWMNMDTLHFANVPKVCLIESSAPLTDMGQAGQALGLEGVVEDIRLDPVPADRAALLSEVLKLKRREGLYRQGTGSVVLGEASGGQRTFKASVAIPSRLSPGGYAMEVFAVRDGKVVAQAAKAVDVNLTGVTAMMADLAFNHDAWYGVLASIIAILAGLGIGLVFQSKEPH